MSRKATIGRSVLLVAAASLISSIGAAFVVGKLVQHDPAQPFTATITYVHSDSLVNLVVHDHNGHSHALTSVQLLQPDQDGEPGTTYAYWPVFTTDQATAGDGASDTGAASTGTGLAASSGATSTGDASSGAASTTGDTSGSTAAADVASTGAAGADPASNGSTGDAGAST